MTTFSKILTTVLDAVFPPRASERLIRNCTLADIPTHVQSVSYTTPATRALTSYRNPLCTALIQEMKFHKNELARVLLSQLLRDELQGIEEEFLPLASGALLLVPLPLSRARQRARGYNQSELLCLRALPHHTQLVWAPELLVRTRDTAPQTTLTKKARKANMRGAFIAARSISPHDTIILVDDVVTTGATLQAAIDALHAAGARHILPLALAH